MHHVCDMLDVHSIPAIMTRFEFVFRMVVCFCLHIANGGSAPVPGMFKAFSQPVWKGAGRVWSSGNSSNY